MTKCERIMLSNRPDWSRQRMSDAEWLHFKRAEDRQYTCDEALYYVESRHPLYREDRPNFYCPVCFFTWSLARAKRRAYEERKRGWSATIYNNQTDGVIN